MNTEWSDLNKIVQTKIKSASTYNEGIDNLLELRNQIMQIILKSKDELTREEFDAIPFINQKGYHSKTIAYSIWHIFRIEDIVAHTLICNDEEIFFLHNYQRRINSSIITTGNELVKNQIVDFSKQLDLNELYSYIIEVKNSTDKLIKTIPYNRMKEKVSDNKESLESLNVVSKDENSFWLINYWCNKNIQGLFKMPFSRHWIMHTEAILRIKSKLTVLRESKNHSSTL